MRSDGGGMALWSSTAWRERVVDWLDDRLRAAGIARTGPVAQPRIRPWATVLTAPTTAGPVWLKAAATGTAFEAGLSLLLHRVVPQRVLAPIAADPDRGWILLPDGGRSLRDLAGGGPAAIGEDALLDVLGAALFRYGQLQRALAPHTDELLALGLVDMRPAVLAERFEQALAGSRVIVERHGDAADRATWRRLAGHRRAVADRCARLADRPGAPSVDHNDLHADNVLVVPGEPDRVRFTDWGDAVLAHPFAAALVPLRSVRAALGAGPGDPRLHRVRDGYLAAFADLGSHAELVETLELACRLGLIARSLVWMRALGEEEVAAAWARAPFDELAGLLSGRYLGGG